MASSAILPLFKVHGMQIGTDSTKNPPLHQVQVQLKNGRRFVLRGLRVQDRTLCETAIQIIENDKCIRLEEFVEVKPAKDSEAYDIMAKKGFLAQFQIEK